MEKISGVYKITNTITGDFYIGSSKNIKSRWAHHKIPSMLNQCPNNPMYLDMRKYGLDNFEFEILAEVEVDKLKEKEQQFIETLQPTYNNYNAKGWNIERYKEYEKSDKRKKAKKEYEKTDKRKKYKEEYYKSDKYKEYQREYQREYKQSTKGKESHKKSSNKYNNQLCFYNGETLTLCALSMRFKRKGIEHPTIEAKKYLIKNNNPIEFYDVYP